MLRRNVKTALLFFLVCFLGMLLEDLTDCSCDATQQYNWTVQFGIGAMIYSILEKVVFFIAGFTFFILIKKKICSEIYIKTKYIYFAALPVLVFHNQFLQIPENISNRSIELSICEKSWSNGLQTNSKTLNQKEYKYLKHQLLLLPDLPQSADSIDINYYRDNFLGEFILTIHFLCDNLEPIDTANKHWITDAANNSINKKKVGYTDDNGRN